MIFHRQRQSDKNEVKSKCVVEFHAQITEHAHDYFVLISTFVQFSIIIIIQLIYNRVLTTSMKCDNIVAKKKSVASLIKSTVSADLAN